MPMDWRYDVSNLDTGRAYPLKALGIPFTSNNTQVEELTRTLSRKESTRVFAYSLLIISWGGIVPSGISDFAGDGLEFLDNLIGEVLRRFKVAVLLTGTTASLSFRDCLPISIYLGLTRRSGIFVYWIQGSEKLLATI